MIGAGAMGGLAAAALRRAEIGEVTIANRTRQRGTRLVHNLGEHGIPAHAVGLDDLAGHIAHADLVVSCTGATGVVVPVSAVRPRSTPLASGRFGLRSPSR